jgi:hypothetical protein
MICGGCTPPDDLPSTPARRYAGMRHACLHGVATYDDDENLGPAVVCDCDEPHCQDTQRRADRLLALPGNLP